MEELTSSSSAKHPQPTQGETILSEVSFTGQRIPVKGTVDRIEFGADDCWLTVYPRSAALVPRFEYPNAVDFRK